MSNPDYEEVSMRQWNPPQVAKWMDHTYQRATLPAKKIAPILDYIDGHNITGGQLRALGTPTDVRNLFGAAVADRSVYTDALLQGLIREIRSRIRVEQQQQITSASGVADEEAEFNIIIQEAGHTETIPNVKKTNTIGEIKVFYNDIHGGGTDFNLIYGGRQLNNTATLESIGIIRDGYTLSVVDSNRD
eukprot:783951_1